MPGYQQVKTIWVQGFQGLSDSVSPGANPRLTNQLQNVKVQHGQVRPRGGLNPYPCSGYTGLTESDPSSADIIGIWTYPIANDFLDDALVRMLPTMMEVLTPEFCWQDITGSPLHGSVTTRPQASIIDDVLIMVNEGLDKPQKFEGNPLVPTAAIAGGTSPFAKSVCAYTGFLMLGNISDDGTFTDVFDGYRMIRYSDDWDTDWSSCAGNEIVLVETSGSLLAMAVLGQDLFCYKSDGVVRVHWTGGATRFTQKKLDFNQGIIAPLSLAVLADQLHCFLGTDAVLYLADPAGKIESISYDTLFDTIPPTIALNKLKYARALVDDEESTYYLFYDRTGLPNMLLDSYASYNWRTKEFCKGVMGKHLNAFTNHRPATGAPQALIATSTTLVYEFDQALTDDGVKIIRYWTTGWVSLEEEGWFVGARLIFQKPVKGEAHVRVSVASNLDETFLFQSIVRLKGTSDSDKFVEVSYTPPSIFGNMFNIKVEFTNRIIEAKVQLRRVGLEVSPTKPMRTTTGRTALAAEEA